MQTTNAQSPQFALDRSIRAWLLCVCGLILLIVSVGGITRLTGSGLSIVEWQPIMGAIPPLSELEWEKAFREYQRFPQYLLLNQDMTLSEFKFIFFWEYIHRLLGRFIGLAFALPWLWFWLRRKLPAGMNRKLGIALLIGSAQGLMGWLMVKSGLVDRPYVSHFRLAAHLSLALLLLSYLYWLLMGAENGRTRIRQEASFAPSLSRVRLAVTLFTGLVALQILYGAFVAGLKAGYAYPTFPKMMGDWIAPAAWEIAPVWRNFWENPAMVQFIHRTLGWVLLGSATVLALSIRRSVAHASVRRRATWLALSVFAQFLLGVSTLLLHVPVTIAVAHQLGACAVLLASLSLLHSLGEPVN